MPAQHLDVFDLPISANDHLHLNLTGQVYLPGEFRVYRSRLRNRFSDFLTGRADGSYQAEYN
jgi:hypothetical protein